MFKQNILINVKICKSIFWFWSFCETRIDTKTVLAFFLLGHEKKNFDEKL